MACCCLRFTPENTFEGYPTANFEELILEMNDVYAITEMLDDEGLEIVVLDSRIANKKRRTLKYMETSRQLNTLKREL